MPKRRNLGPIGRTNAVSASTSMRRPVRRVPTLSPTAMRRPVLARPSRPNVQKAQGLGLQPHSSGRSGGTTCLEQLAGELGLNAEVLASSLMSDAQPYLTLALDPRPVVWELTFFTSEGQQLKSGSLPQDPLVVEGDTFTVPAMAIDEKDDFHSVAYVMVTPKDSDKLYAPDAISFQWSGGADDTIDVEYRVHGLSRFPEPVLTEGTVRIPWGRVLHGYGFQLARPGGTNEYRLSFKAMTRRVDA